MQFQLHLTRSNRLAVLGLGVLLLGLVLGGCTRSYTVSESETQGVAVPETPSVTLTNFDGPVEVVTGESGRVQADLTRRSSNPDAAAAQAEVDNITMSISQSGPDVGITIIYDGTMNEETGAEAAVVLAVPPGSAVRAETSTGTITFDEGIAEATGVVETGAVTFAVTEEEPFTLRAEAVSGEILSDVEALSSRPLSGRYEGRVGEEAGREFVALLGTGKVFLRLR